MHDFVSKKHPGIPDFVHSLFFFSRQGTHAEVQYSPVLQYTIISTVTA